MPTSLPIIDLHCHTAGIGAGNSGCFVSRALRHSMRYRFFLAAFGVSQAELELHGDRLLMERLAARLGGSTAVSGAVVLALDGIVAANGRLDRERTELYIPNDYLAQECRRHDNLLFGASINPYRQGALDELDKVVADGAVLLKWLPSIQFIDPGERRLITFYKRLQELGLPLLTHTGSEESFTWARNELADPELLRLPLELGVTVIAAHCASNGASGGERNFARFLRLAHQFPNLYADISSLTQVNRLGHLRRVLRQQELHSRLLYGSDMPLIATAITSPWLHALSLPLAEARRLAAITNPWDRDVALKMALGAPAELFTQSARLLNITTR